MNSIRAFAFLIWSAALFSATAQSWVRWTGDGGNGHWYLVMRTPQLVSWDSARSFATNDGGYLATITSAAENAFVVGSNVAAVRFEFDASRREFIDRRVDIGYGDIEDSERCRLVVFFWIKINALIP